MRKATRRYLRAQLGVAVALVVLLASPAWGDTQTRLDPDDSAGGLDLETVTHRHKITSSGRIILRFRLSTYEAWQFADEQEEEFISVEFNLDKDNAVERCADVDLRLKDGAVELYADVYKNCTQEGAWDRVGSARNVTRPDEKSLTVTLARRLLGRRVRVYDWRIVTAYGDAWSQECPIVTPGGPDHGTARHNGFCEDFTPWIKHRL